MTICTYLSSLGLESRSLKFGKAAVVPTSWVTDSVGTCGPLGSKMWCKVDDSVGNISNTCCMKPAKGCRGKQGGCSHCIRPCLVQFWQSWHRSHTQNKVQVGYLCNCTVLACIIPGVFACGSIFSFSLFYIRKRCLFCTKNYCIWILGEIFYDTMCLSYGLQVNKALL